MKIDFDNHVSRRPTTQRYLNLISRLTQRSAEGDASGDDLAAAINCLRYVIEFLHEDATVRLTGNTRYLEQLLLALVDVKQGAKPPIFEIEKAPGAPVETSFDIAQGWIAACLFILIEIGMTQEEASNFIATELQKIGLKQKSGKPITSRLIQDWRYKIDGTGSQRAQRTFLEMISRFRDDLNFQRASTEGRRNMVTGSLRSLKTMGF